MEANSSTAHNSDSVVDVIADHIVVNFDCTEVAINTILVRNSVDSITVQDSRITDFTFHLVHSVAYSADRVDCLGTATTSTAIGTTATFFVESQ